jgi:hypothetical protein
MPRLTAATADSASSEPLKLSNARTSFMKRPRRSSFRGQNTPCRSNCCRPGSQRPPIGMEVPEVVAISIIAATPIDLGQALLPLKAVTARPELASHDIPAAPHASESQYSGRPHVFVSSPSPVDCRSHLVLCGPPWVRSGQPCPGDSTEIEVRGHITAIDGDDMDVDGVAFVLAANTEYLSRLPFDVTREYLEVGVELEVEGRT